MAAINHVILVGRLTRDPELRKTKTGTSYCRFTVACDRRKTSEGKDQEADFISCVAWRQSADFLYDYAQKGNVVSVEGSIQTGSYTDRDGRKVYTTDILADRVQLMEGKKQKADYPNRGESKSLKEMADEADEEFGKETSSDPDDLDNLPF